MITGNKGEWSEAYVLLRLLAQGRIYAADENLEQIDEMYFPILKVLREEIQNRFSGDMCVGKTPSGACDARPSRRPSGPKPAR